MALTFHEIILPEEYAPEPQGGPRFDNSLITVPTSGVEVVNRSHPTALHEYTIPYSLLTMDRQEWLYRFFLIVGGIGGAFRMLAPEPFNQGFEAEAMQAVPGSTVAFRLVKTHTVVADTAYGGATSSYVQRIVKPIYGEVEIYVSGSPVNLTADGAMNWTTGVFTFDSPPGATPEATGRYHLPMRFTDDFFNPQYDITARHGGIGLKEVLPKTLNIS